jgi:hypothetical protein
MYRQRAALPVMVGRIVAVSVVFVGMTFFIERGVERG